MRFGRLGLQAATLAALIVLAGCALGTGESPVPSSTAVPEPSASPAPIASLSTPPATSPAPTATPSPVPTTPLGMADLKYALLARFGPISWCDPDFYPVAHQDEQQSADEHFAQIRADTQTYDAITAHLGLDPNVELSPAERLAVYRDWKLLNAVVLTPVGEAFGFDLITITDQTTGRGQHTTGTIDALGTIAIEQQEPDGLRPCPICLARGTRIDTPNGSVPVETLSVGDLVWTSDLSGNRIVAPLIETGSTSVARSHEVVHLVLDDGREVWVSPGHSLADGRPVGALVPGDVVGGARVTSAELVPYAGGATFDVLPAGPTGDYWANGVLLSSTLR
jgi:hypothetical protein